MCKYFMWHKSDIPFMSEDTIPKVKHGGGSFVLCDASYSRDMIAELTDKIHEVRY